ncbi:MAG: LysR family transcriptional regulator [Acidobacteriota bacterium]|nr:LysR family transcriptional regulator [Acidobacteriota bacterium]
MLRNETKLMESAIALAEELHYQRAARKLRISQPMLTKNIQDLESILGSPLFVRNRSSRKNVTLNDAGRAYVQQARLSLLYGERAVQAAKAVMQNVDVPFHVGRSPYTDPFLTSTLLSISLPLYPKLRIELASQYSIDLVHDLLDGVLSLVIANEPPESALLTQLLIAESPFYIAMARRDELACKPSVSMADLNNRKWILFERKLHSSLYDSILDTAERLHVKPASVQHVTAPEEAFPFVADNSAVAFLVKAGALLMARNGVTIRPLAEPELRLRTYLVSRADDDSKVASELVRSFMRKISEVSAYRQLTLPISV